MQKAGTSWLFDQLQHHPDFWMPPVKELHYFDKDFPDRKLARTIDRADNSLEKLSAIRERTNVRPIDDRDLGFFADVKAHSGVTPNIKSYGKLFRHKGDLLSGDITPALCTLPDRKVAEIADAFPEARVVLLLRDPVDRAWSQISMSFRREKFKSSWLNKAEKFQRFMETREVEVRSFPTKIYERWANAVPASKLRYFFFDELGSNPDGLRSDVISFIGGDPSKTSADLTAGFNRKSDREKLDMTDLVREMLVKYFTDELHACARVFGGPARSWLTKYGL
jgi:hypothetical protein